ncbi:hypothetical protein LTR17_002740 [Elasticomyces elasticus]|nr:hypothetical protein LTR17_002740 [Elasticomyces elasticus]
MARLRQGLVTQHVSAASNYLEDLADLNKSGRANCLRLLRPHPDFDLTKPLWQLWTVDMDEAPPYAALSYSWSAGDTRSREITLEHHVRNTRHSPTWTVLTINADLLDALICLEEVNACGWIWVDAICINQSSIDEKEQQVAKMGNIFGRAQRVFVGLGPPETEVGHPPSRHDVEMAKRLPALFVGWDRGVTASKIMALASTGERAWFSRLWTMQEVVLAQQVIFIIGTQTFGPTLFQNILEDLAKYWRAYGNRLYEVADHFRATVNAIFDLRADLLGAGDQGLSLRSLLLRMQSQHSTLPHDRIYGLLGLVKADYLREIPIRYDEAIGEVFAATTALIIRTEGNFDIILESLERQDRASDDTGGERLPSWVPDIAASDVWTKGTWTYLSRRHFAAAKETPPCISYSYPYLTIWAFRCDELLSCEVLTTQRAPMSQSPLSKQQQSEEGLGQFSKTLDDKDQDPANPVERLFERLIRTPLSEARYFFRTKDGLEGFSVGREVYPGDIVIVAPGCRLPLLLRPYRREIEADQTIYQFIDGCLVKNIMWGEVIDAAERIGRRVEEYCVM